jgi:hypothetical protein
MPGVKTQTMILAVEVVVECPHCDKQQEGFIGNPAGGQFECEDCGSHIKCMRKRTLSIDNYPSE